MDTSFKIGDTVKWAEPLCESESTERFTILEINGDRCLIEFICCWAIRPTQIAIVHDLTKE